VRELFYIDPKQALPICDEALLLGAELDRKKHVAFLLRSRADILFRLSDYPAAQIAAGKAHAAYVELGIPIGQAQALLAFGGSCIQLGEYEEALPPITEALAIAQKLGDPTWEGAALNYLGILYDQLGEYDSATTYYLKGLAVQEEVEDLNGQASSLANLGWVSYESGDYQGALDYYQRSLAIFHEHGHGDTYGICVAKNSMGDIYFKLNEYQLAISNHLESLELARARGDRFVESGSLKSIGKLYFHLGKHELAHASFWQSLEVKEHIGDRQGIVEVLLNLGLLYTHQNMIDEALMHLNRALSLGDEIHTRAFLYQLHEAISDAYERKGDTTRALDHYKQFHRIRSEITGEESNKRVRLLQTRLALEKLEKETEVVRLKTERMEHELHLARKVQMGLLPVSPPDIPGLDIASVCLPAYEAGGDYFDFFELGEGKLGVAIGDVSGKGLPAAIYMTLVKGVLKSQALPDAAPRDVLARANRMIYEAFSRGWFISMIYAVIDQNAGTITYARGGHNPPLFFSSQERQVVDRSRGMALGLAGDPLFSDIINEITVPIEPGDTLLFYTDGFTEAMNTDHEELGEDVFRAIASRSAFHSSAREMLDAIGRSVQAFTGNAPQHDDMTMVAIKIKE